MKTIPTVWYIIVPALVALALVNLAQRRKAEP